MAGATGVVLAEHSARAWSTECRAGRGAVVLGRPPQVTCLLYSAIVPSTQPSSTGKSHSQNQFKWSSIVSGGDRAGYSGCTRPDLPHRWAFLKTKRAETFPPHLPDVSTPAPTYWLGKGNIICCKLYVLGLNIILTSCFFHSLELWFGSFTILRPLKWCADFDILLLIKNSCRFISLLWVKGEGPALWLMKEAPSLPPQRAGSFHFIHLGQEQRLPLKLSQITQEPLKCLCV